MSNCISCGKQTAENVKFPCPSCSKETLRCDKCRSLSIEYKCECGFEGP